MTLLSILLEENAGGSGLGSMLMIVGLIAVFYFFMIRPQTKKQKEMKRFRDSLKNGDKVVTAGGIYGKIRDINDTTGVVTLEVADNVRIRIDKNSIYQTVQDVAEGNAAGGNVTKA